MRKEIVFLVCPALLAVVGCGSTAAGPSGRADATTASSAAAGGSKAPTPTTRFEPGTTRPVPATSQPASTLTQPPSGLVIAGGDGWTRAGLDGPVPAPGSCHYGRAADGYLLPDRGCTPGAIDPSVTQADLDSTICRRGGYTTSVRPPSSLTDAFKPQAERAYQDPTSTGQTELDHLVPLELGGASDTRNLWPEPDQGSPAQFDPSDPFGINAKDGVEDHLHDAVCSGQVDLRAAQVAIATSWITAEATLGVRP